MSQPRDRYYKQPVFNLLALHFFKPLGLLASNISLYNYHLENMALPLTKRPLDLLYYIYLAVGVAVFLFKLYVE